MRSMKKIILEESVETRMVQMQDGSVQPGPVKFNDKKILVDMLDSIPAEGLKMKEIRFNTNLIEKLEAATDEIELDEIEFMKIKVLLETFNFNIRSKHLLKLADKFEIE